MIRWISPEKLGASTTKVSTDFLKQNGIEVVSEWYHSPHGVDLFIWKDSRTEMIKYQLSILGLVLEWSLTEGVKTGMIIEEESVNPLNKMNTSDLLNYDERPLNSTLEYGAQVLSEIKGLSESQKHRILSDLGHQYKSPRRPSWGLIRYLKSWFKS